MIVQRSNAIGSCGNAGSPAILTSGHVVEGIDTLWDEDRSRIRTWHGPQNMATLRNVTLNQHRANGAMNMAVAICNLSYEPFTAPLDLLNIPL
ncbi:hypothetical protein ACH4YO_42865 [Streptomyces noursei]|uniref:hypothetical protein n=1 Tax=Streptomyces noursei TaxID=1971 RepID=UPI0033DEE97E